MFEFWLKEHKIGRNIQNIFVFKYLYNCLLRAFKNKIICNFGYSNKKMQQPIIFISNFETNFKNIL